MIQTRISLLRNKFFFLGIIALLSFMGVIAFNNFQSNETLLQKIERLELQNDGYKQIEVEKTELHQRLRAERDLYERTKKELNQKLRDLQQVKNKETQDSSLRFNSLQQQYKILKTQHDDLEQHCEKVKKDIATDNDGLKSQLVKVKSQLAKTHMLKENDMMMWKTKYENLLRDHDKLQSLFNSKGSTDDEHQQLLQLKYKTYQLEQEIKGGHEPETPKLSPPDKSKNFREQIPVSEDHYKISIEIRNKLVGASIENAGKLNAVDNFQIIQNREQNQNVLQQPMPFNGKSSTTTKTPPTSVANKENLLTPIKADSKSTRTSAKAKPLPKGFLPIPELENGDNSKTHLNEDPKPSLDESLVKPQNIEIDELENGAHEVINDNDFNIEEKQNRANSNLDVFDPDTNIVNNAAEEFDGHKQVDRKALRNDEMDLEIIKRPGKDKLNDEITGDHGKEPDGYPDGMEDLHIEGQPEEDNDLGDVGEYDHDDPRKGQGGVAERN